MVGGCHGDWCEGSVCSDAKSEIAPGQGTASLINFYVISAARRDWRERERKKNPANKGVATVAIEGQKKSRMHMT